MIRRKVLMILATLQWISAPLAMGQEHPTAIQVEDQNHGKDYFNRCDTKVFAHYWHKSIDQAEAEIDNQVAQGHWDMLENQLNQAREKALNDDFVCRYNEGDLQYRDIEALADYWHTSVGQAKTLAGEKLAWYGQEYLEELLAEYDGQQEEVQTLEEAQLDAYWQSNLSYCDTMLLAKAWHTGDFYNTKLAIGNKILGQQERFIDQSLKKARQRALQQRQLCSFYDEGLSYSDIQILAKMWGVKVDQAKIMASEKITRGDLDLLQDQLREARGENTDLYDGAPLFLDEFFNSTYTYCDAHLLARMWHSQVYDEKIYIGSKIAVGAQDILKQDLKEARAKAHKDRFACFYTEGGFGLKDAELLSKYWNKPLLETKAIMGNKVTAGQTQSLQKELQMVRKSQNTPGYRVKPKVRKKDRPLKRKF